MARPRNKIDGFGEYDGENFVVFGTEGTDEPGTDEGTGTGTDEGTGSNGTANVGSGKPRTDEGTRKAKAKATQADTVILEVVEPKDEPDEPKKRRGRPKGYSPKANKEAEELAPLVLMLFEALAVQALGPIAGFTPEERAMITPPLTRILARMDRGRLEKVQTYSDPLLLAFGLIMWGTRVASLKALENKTRKQDKANPPVNPVEDNPAPSSNGNPYGGGLGPLDQYISGV